MHNAQGLRGKATATFLDGCIISTSALGHAPKI